MNLKLESTLLFITAILEIQVPSLGQEDPLEKRMAIHFLPGEFHG